MLSFDISALFILLSIAAFSALTVKTIFICITWKEERMCGEQSSAFRTNFSI
jgi:hypothetical protein